MKTQQELNKCTLCGKNGKELSLYSTPHKEHGQISVCKECWKKLYANNKIVSGSSSCSSSCSSCCKGC